MSTAPDIDGYFARIGYSGAHEPTLEVLKGIVHQHISTIPFENLDVLLNRGISLDPETVERKLVADRRGGYCFEQNGYLLRILTTLGFSVKPLSARVRIGRPRDLTPPRTHLFLRVEIEGVPWLTDVGVGGMSPTEPLRFETDIEQKTPHETRRIIEHEGRFLHQALLGEVWSDVYEFTGEEMPLIDRELANWFTSTHPASGFRQNLMAARASEAGTRYAILNNEFTHRRGAEILDRRVIRNPGQLLDLLDKFFGLKFPPETQIQAQGLTWPV